MSPWNERAPLRAALVMGPLAATLLAGCVVGPNFHTPPAPQTARYTRGPLSQLTQAARATVPAEQASANANANANASANAGATATATATVQGLALDSSLPEPAQWWTLLDSPRLDVTSIGCSDPCGAERQSHAGGRTGAACRGAAARPRGGGGTVPAARSGCHGRARQVWPGISRTREIATLQLFLRGSGRQLRVRLHGRTEARYRAAARRQRGAATAAAGRGIESLRSRRSAGAGRR